MVQIANCWSGSPNVYVGTKPPCATVFSQNLPKAYYFLNKNQSSTSLGKRYYDVDAFRAEAGCYTKLQENGSSWAYDRRGKDHYWVKISSDRKDVVITSVTC
ncbi:hypothetical protein BG844_12355 [Couchioplanes caeruleus subsp. caeruleus]|uniref:Peptidase inhibitor family I36 n=2 Tax=Couchioplanes caeruleus TaxID=56438 RepID=A0A1K0FML6_9ACTN|nr:hypothetical protein BG844_12355 [Couchioplanes caeruleus subsp. caeruleus]